MRSTSCVREACVALCYIGLTLEDYLFLYFALLLCFLHARYL